MTASDPADWRPAMEREILGVLHRRGVPNAVVLAEECAQAMQSFVNSIRAEAYDRVSDRFRDFITEEQSRG
jgi:hypothetical protein